MRFLAFASALIFALTSCVSPRKPPAPKLMAPVEAMNFYIRTMDGFLKRLKSGDPLTRYQELWESVLWAQVQKDDMIVSLNSGHLARGVMAVSVPEHPRLQKPGPTLQTVPGEKFSYVAIRPHPISAFWAPVFLVHELAHLDQYNRGLKLSSGESELGAYRAEMEALRRQTGEQLGSHLDEQLRKLEVTSHDGLLHLARTNATRLHRALSKLDQTLSPETAVSLQEREMRTGFLLVALALRIMEQAGPREEEVLAKQMDELLKEISKYPAGD